MKFWIAVLTCLLLIMGVGHSDVFAEPRAIHEGARGIDLDAAAGDVVLGRHGVGAERVQSLVSSGLTAAQAREVQARVNKLMPAVRHTVPSRASGQESGWSGRIPEHYGRGSGCTRQQAGVVAAEMRSVGANSGEVEKMLGIISRESGCKSSAINMNSRSRDRSHGLCQQNSLASWFDQGQLLGHIDRWAFPNDFRLNAYSCALMWSRCGFLPWQQGNYGCQRPR